MDIYQPNLTKLEIKVNFFFLCISPQSNSEKDCNDLSVLL